MELIAYLALASAAFVATHFLASAPLRRALVASLGETMYLGAYSLGEDWKRFAAVTSNLPFRAIAGGRNRFSVAEIGWTKIAVGLALYALLLSLHSTLFGVRPY